MTVRILPLLALLAALPARADLFSPGPLSRAHARLEGLRACTSCHAAGQQLSPERCLDCHQELRGRIAAGQGFHGRIPADRRACEECHHEHQGRDFPLIEWKPSRERFDHAQTGWLLKGKHQALACDRCHAAKLIADVAVRKLLADSPSRTTYLGLPTRCGGCHFDEHRGQLGVDCERCHSEKAFKPPALFDHAKTAYPLEGRHTGVACEKCHLREEDRSTSKDALPAPVHPTFLRFKGLAHAACTDCHRDPHSGRFGPSCVGCHTPASWLEIRSLEKERGFHERTRYPLRGAHASAPCRACHGQPPKYKGLAFERCGDCHPDAHLGQLTGGPPACERCHHLASFKPAAFEIEDHQRTAYPLEGAHGSVGCTLCHKQDPKLADLAPVQTRRALRERKRPERFSFAKFDVAFDRCEACHADPHVGQFAGKPCASCHEVASFRRVRFEHDRDSRFPLTGKHRDVACAGCHPRQTEGGASVVRYKPLEAACSACHSDPHLGQFARNGSSDCARCHTPEGFKPARFDHSPPVTSFPLEGRHATVACERCHPEIALEPELKVRRYSSLPAACEGCHEDHHRGEFRGRESLSSRDLAAPQQSGETRCGNCHSAESWRGATIAHERTGFPLEGAHQRVSCRACHPNGFDTATSTRCSGCHRDAHGGELGQRCEGCHDTSSWRSRFDADAHRRTNFPLVGRHAFLPCEECHRDVRDRSFTRAAVRCDECHLGDYQRTALGSIDHAAAGFSTRCQDCHDPWRFSPARIEAHEACFQIDAGEHAGMRCLDCHTRLTGAAFSGTCFTGTASCTGCHEHRCAEVDSEHRDVPGYQCKDRKCYECHRFSRRD